MDIVLLPNETRLTYHIGVTESVQISMWKFRVRNSATSCPEFPAVFLRHSKRMLG